MGRKKVYENDAEKMAAFRAKKSRVDLLLPQNIGETLDELSAFHLVSKNRLVNAMVKFALTNHDWKKSGVWLGVKS